MYGVLTGYDLSAGFVKTVDRNQKRRTKMKDRLTGILIGAVSIIGIMFLMGLFDGVYDCGKYNFKKGSKGAGFKIDRENGDLWWVSGGKTPHMYKVTEGMKEKSK